MDYIFNCFHPMFLPANNISSIDVHKFVHISAMMITIMHFFYAYVKYTSMYNILYLTKHPFTICLTSFKKIMIISLFQKNPYFNHINPAPTFSILQADTQV